MGGGQLMQFSYSALLAYKLQAWPTGLLLQPQVR